MKKIVFLVLFLVMSMICFNAVGESDQADCRKLEEKLLSYGYGKKSTVCSGNMKRDLSEQLYIIENDDNNYEISRSRNSVKWKDVFKTITIDNFGLDILSIKQYTNNAKKNILELQMEFYNNSDKPISYNSALFREIYQDGIQLNDYVMGEIDTMTKIRPGKSIIVTESFEYRTPSNKSIIEIDVHPFLDNNPNNTYSGVIYKLK